MDSFSAIGCIRFGWRTFKRRGWFLVGMTALMIVVSWAIAALGGSLGERDGGALLGAAVNIGLSTLLTMGFTAVMIRAHDALESAEVSDLWHPRPFWKFLAAEILTGLIVLVGLILLVIPGVILMLMYLFVPYLVIDKELGPIEALKESARITRGFRLELLLLFLIAFVLNIFGALALLAGLLVSIPVTTLALVHAYRVLALKAKGAVPATA